MLLVLLDAMHGRPGLPPLRAVPEPLRPTAAPWFVATAGASDRASRALLLRAAGLGAAPDHAVAPWRGRLRSRGALDEEADVAADERARLVPRAQHGDRDAFAALAERHGDRLLRFLQTMTGDDHIAGDLRQDALQRALTRLDQLASRRSSAAGSCRSRATAAATICAPRCSARTPATTRWPTSPRAGARR